MTFRSSRIILVTLLLLLPTGGYAEEHFPGATWEHLPAGSGGWSAATLAKAEAWSKLIGSTAVMIVQHGLVVADWGDAAERTELYSVRKSLLSALIGIAVAQGKISLNSTLAQLGIDDNAPSLTKIEKQATVRMLLQARSGIYHAALYETQGMADNRPVRGSYAKGAFWYYNNWDFNALGTIYEHATGAGIYDSLDALIGRPIGMQDYRPQDGTYFTGAASIHRAYPLRMSARDLARFALLYLHDGIWAGKEVVPAQWVEDSTRPYSQTGFRFGSGYGYLWWTGPFDNSIVPLVTLPPGTFFAVGNCGQFAFVMPADDLIVVNLNAHCPKSGSYDPRPIGRLLWLVLDAGGFQDIGPDASIEAASGKSEDGATLPSLLSGKTLVYGDTAIGGPFRMRLGHEGAMTLFKGESTAGFDTGTWEVADNKFCRNWITTNPQHACLAVTRDGAAVQFFDPNGLMFLNARLTE